ncbi:WhiB family transcriptional regulator [Streptomyces abikoensis]|uniref:Transcriptional regulator WhiB n=1 Tax=Streptomyces abikoensis TaxID=97398 RepID=A0ABW7TCF1_9ACTN
MKMIRDWLDHAACRDADPELFFTVGYDAQAMQDREEAKAYCRRCRVRAQCLDLADQTDVEDGLWGDTEKDKRRPPTRGDLTEMFYSRTKLLPGGHLEWTGFFTKRRCPVLRAGTKNLSAYRVAFRLCHGREPEGHVTSRCGQRGCVEPSHMQDSVTRAQPAA